MTFRKGEEEFTGEKVSFAVRCISPGTSAAFAAGTVPLSFFGGFCFRRLTRSSDYYRAVRKVRAGCEGELEGFKSIRNYSIATNFQDNLIIIQ